MSKEFSQFPTGAPPVDTDRFLIGRPDIASPTGFSNFIMTWAEIKAAVGSGTGIPGLTIPGNDGVDVEEPIMIPGAKGDPGSPGAAGITATTVFFLESEAPEEVMPIPGEKGAAGATGINGTIGRDGAILMLEPEIEEQAIIPGPKGDKGDAGGGGGGSITATTVTVASPALEASVVITDAAVTPADRIIADWGNCLQTDENHPGMGQIVFNAIAGTGQFVLELFSTDQSMLFGLFKINYMRAT
jgi:hypothetical protein